MTTSLNSADSGDDSPDGRIAIEEWSHKKRIVIKDIARPRAGLPILEETKEWIMINLVANEWIMNITPQFVAQGCIPIIRESAIRIFLRRILYTVYICWQLKNGASTR